jgi:hypothetical protein
MKKMRSSTTTPDRCSVLRNVKLIIPTVIVRVRRDGGAGNISTSRFAKLSFVDAIELRPPSDY